MLMRYRYLEYVGKDDAALQEADQARGKVKSAWPATLYALGLYRRGQCEEALKVLDAMEPSHKGAFQETMRMFILAELPDGPLLALQAYRKNSELLTGGYYAIFKQAALLLLGRRAEAIAASRELRQHGPMVPASFGRPAVQSAAPAAIIACQVAGWALLGPRVATTW